MAWQMQLKTPNTNNEWVSIKPNGKDEKPYEYETKEEAERMIDICYREVIRGFYGDDHQGRVVEV